MERHTVNRRKADRDAELRGDGTNALDDFAKETGAILEASPVAAGAGMGAEKFVAEITVTMLYIDKVETQPARQARGFVKVFNDGFYVRVRQHGKVRRQTQPPIEKRMMVENARLGATVGVWATVAARIGKLQTDQQAVVGAGGQPMLFDQRSAQAGQAFLRVRGRHQLIWIGTPFVGDGHCFSSPNQFRTAAAEALPAPNRVLRWVAVGQSVPALHGMHHDATADFDIVTDQRLAQ